MHDLHLTLIKRLSIAPFPLHTLLLELREYSQPLFKVHQLVKSGLLIRLKRGFFCVNPVYSDVKIDSRVVANELYGEPSYVSLEYALNFYGLIPDVVTGVTSVVTGRSKRITTPIGWYSYRTLPENLFAFGIHSVTGFLMASPEKALCDYLYTRSNLRISSPKTLYSFLEEDVRFDFDSFKDYDKSVFHQYAQTGIKHELFSALERLFV